MPTKTPFSGLLHRAFRPIWIDLAPLVSGEDAPPLTDGEARLWALVLSSRHVPHRLRTLRPDEGVGHSVQVQEWFADRAVEEIRLYLKENTPDGRAIFIPDLRPVSGYEPTFFIMFLMVAFFWVTSRTYPAWATYPELWIAKGSADAGAILAGQWWRTITALTLHADGAHVAGNGVIGGVFVWLVCRRIGSGLAWTLTILAGALGNLVNSMVLGAHHDAIGFSTASFGAAGILAAIAPFSVGGGLHGFGTGSLTQRLLRFTRSALIPFAAGLGLLGMLGVGENTDLGGHFFGFLSGLAVGLPAGLLTTRLGVPGKRADEVLILTAIAAPVLAWTWAW